MILLTLLEVAFLWSARQERQENFFSELTLCADSYLVSVPLPRYRNGT